MTTFVSCMNQRKNRRAVIMVTGAFKRFYKNSDINCITFWWSISFNDLFFKIRQISNYIILFISMTYYTFYKHFKRLYTWFNNSIKTSSRSFLTTNKLSISPPKPALTPLKQPPKSKLKLKAESSSPKRIFSILSKVSKMTFSFLPNKPPMKSSPELKSSSFQMKKDLPRPRKNKSRKDSSKSSTRSWTTT